MGVMSAVVVEKIGFEKKYRGVQYQRVLRVYFSKLSGMVPAQGAGIQAKNGEKNSEQFTANLKTRQVRLQVNSAVLNGGLMGKTNVLYT